MKVALFVAPVCRHWIRAAQADEGELRVPRHGDDVRRRPDVFELRNDLKRLRVNHDAVAGDPVHHPDLAAVRGGPGAMGIEAAAFALFHHLVGPGLQHVPDADVLVAAVDNDVLLIPECHRSAVRPYLGQPDRRQPARTSACRARPSRRPSAPVRGSRRPAEYSWQIACVALNSSADFLISGSSAMTRVRPRVNWPFCLSILISTSLPERGSFGSPMTSRSPRCRPASPPPCAQRRGCRAITRATLQSRLPSEGRRRERPCRQ